MNNEPVDILVVENNDNERDSIVAALQETIPGVQVVAVHDGEEALDFLCARGAWTDRDGAELPKLILLDLVLPGVDGFSLLRDIRSLESQDPLTCTPVIIFSDSQTRSDITESYRYDVNSFIVKPSSLKEFQAVVTATAQYWLTVRKDISNYIEKKPEHITAR